MYPQVQVQLREKKIGKESQYMVSRPELGSDPPFGSDRESGCDILHVSSSHSSNTSDVDRDTSSCHLDAL